MKKGALKIERGIPIPPARRKSGYTAIFRTMKKGDSVLIPTNIKSVCSILHQLGGSKNFTSRTIGPKKTRVWRSKDES